MVGWKRKRRRALHVGGFRIGMSEHEAREAERERRLADSGRAADQPGMGDAAALVGVEQRGFRGLVPEQRDGLARRLDVAVVLAHGAAACTSAGGAGRKRSSTAFQMRSATISRGARPSTTTMRSGSCAASTR